MTRRYRSYTRSINKRKLGKDPLNSKLGGVCAGFARYLDIDPMVVRIVAVIGLCLAPQPTLIAYGIAYMILDDQII